MELPVAFETKMKEMLGSDYENYLASFSEESYQGLRVNTAKIPVDEFLKISPYNLTPVPWCPNGFYYEKGEKPAKHPFYFAGLYYIQEPSAMTTASLLPIEEGDVVLDLCAAPGGKSTELAARLNGSGLLITNDISNSRAKALLKNIETAQVFEKSEVKVWECRNCGHIVVGTKAPEVCPVCNHPQSYFEVHEENY